MKIGDSIKTKAYLSILNDNEFMFGEIYNIINQKCLDGSYFEKIEVKFDDGRILPCIREELELINMDITSNNKKELVKKHLGVNTSNWVVDNCINLIDESNKIPINLKDLEHLQWIHDRIINICGESENVDFLIRLREIIKKLNEKYYET